MDEPRPNKNKAAPADNYDPDEIDIDAILRESGLFGGIEHDKADSLLPDSNTNRFEQLRLRAGYASRSLNAALASLVELHTMLDAERCLAGQFIAEMGNWERMLLQLEQSYSARFSAVGSKSFERVNMESLLDTVRRQDNRIRDLESRLLDRADSITPPDEPAKAPYTGRLLVLVNGQDNQKFPLRNNVVRLGRDSHNDIRLTADHISRFHALILNDNHSAYIEDLGSANGVMVNSVRINRRKLRSGDIVSLGRTQLKYIDLEESAPGEGAA